MVEKEEYAIVLDYLPYGYPLEGKMMPIAQAIGLNNFTLLQLVPRRGIKLDLKNCDLNKVVQNIMDKMKISNFTRIKTSLDFGSLPLVRCDQSQIEKVFQNLILNALEAMPEGGTLSITTELNKEKSLIRSKVSDTGSGMSKDFIRNSLFKPFQTTKKKGLGIGLIQCKEIVEMHKGRISVESEEGKGTTFTLELPL